MSVHLSHDYLVETLIRVLSLDPLLAAYHPSVDWMSRGGDYYYVLKVPYLQASAAQSTNLGDFEFEVEVSFGKTHEIIPFATANLTGNSCYTVALLGELTNVSYNGFLLENL